MYKNNFVIMVRISDIKMDAWLGLTPKRQAETHDAQSKKKLQHCDYDLKR